MQVFRVFGIYNFETDEKVYILDVEEGGGTRMLSSPHQNDRDICTNGKGACEIHRISYNRPSAASKKCLIMRRP